MKNILLTAITAVFLISSLPGISKNPVWKEVAPGVWKDSPDAPEPRDRNTDSEWTAQPYSDAVEMVVPAGGVEIYLFAGPLMIDAIRRFNLFMGGGCLPPRWGLGFIQRVKTLYSAEQVIREAHDFAEKGYPLDVIGLEPGWQSKSYPCTLEWDNSRFPDPAGFVKTMKDMGVRINLWTNLGKITWRIMSGYLR